MHKRAEKAKAARASALKVCWPLSKARTLFVCAVLLSIFDCGQSNNSGGCRDNSSDSLNDLQELMVVLSIVRYMETASSVQRRPEVRLFIRFGGVFRLVFGAVITVYVATCLLQCGDVESNPGPNFEQALNRLYDRIDSRLSQMESKVTDLFLGVRELTTRFDCIDERLQCLERKCVTADVLDTELRRLEDRIEHCEIYSRRENVLLRGIEESRTEGYGDCKRLVLDLLRQCVPSKEWSEDDIVRAHRLGKVPQNPQAASKPRPMIARFRLWQDKMVVVADKTAREKLRRQNVTVNDDLTRRQREQLTNLRSEGKSGFFRGSRLVTRDLPPAQHGLSNATHRHDDLSWKEWRPPVGYGDRISRADSRGGSVGRGRGGRGSHRGGGTRSNYWSTAHHDDSDVFGRRRGDSSNNDRGGFHTDSRSFSQVLRTISAPASKTSLPAREVSSAPSSPSRLGAVWGAPPSRVASNLHRFRYTPRSPSKQDPPQTSDTTQRRHGDVTQNQRSATAVNPARAGSVESAQATNQREGNPAKRPRPPSSPMEKDANDTPVETVSDNDGDGEEMFVDSYSSVHGDDRDSATLVDTATAGTVDTDHNKSSENTACERVADDNKQCDTDNHSFQKAGPEVSA